MVSSIEAFTNGEQVPLEIRRFTTHSDAEIKYKNKDSERKKYPVQENNPAAIGFNLFADAVKFEIKLPLNDLLFRIKNDQELSKVLKTSRYFFLIKEENAIGNVENPFLREWLGDIYYNMLVVETILSECSLEDANEKIKLNKTSISFPESTQLFQSHFIEKNENEDSEYINDKNIDNYGEIENNLRMKVLEDLSNISQILWSELIFLHMNGLKKNTFLHLLYRLCLP